MLSTLRGTRVRSLAALWQRGHSMTEPSEQMTALLTPLSDARRFLETCAWKPFAQFQQWLFFDYIETECDRNTS